MRELAYVTDGDPLDIHTVGTIDDSTYSDYLRHCTTLAHMPPCAVSLSAEQKTDSSGEVVAHLSVQFKRDQFIEDYDSWGTVRRDLVNQPEQFDVAPHINQAMLRLEALQSLVASDMQPEVDEARMFLSRLLQTNEPQSGTPCFLYVDHLDGDRGGIRFRLEHIPLFLTTT